MTTQMTPGYRPHRATDYGHVVVTSDGWLHVSGTVAELDAYCGGKLMTVLDSATGTVVAEFAPNGDLVDVEHPGLDDVPAGELTGWVAVCCHLADVRHPATSR